MRITEHPCPFEGESSIALMDFCMPMYTLVSAVIDIPLTGPNVDLPNPVKDADVRIQERQPLLGDTCALNTDVKLTPTIDRL